MPDLDKPPHDERLAKLKSRDAKSSTGWKLHVGPFPDWKDVPTW